MTGYNHEDYAESFSDYGSARQMLCSRGWILERQIEGSPCHDGMGCYPHYSCEDWSKIHLDLEGMGKDLISLSLVTDPLETYDVEYLKGCFGDSFFAFKGHFVIDLGRPLRLFVDSLHRRKAQKGLQSVRVEKCDDPSLYTDEWVELYGNLIKRHNIVGMRAFSRHTFSKQLSVPGAVVFRAVYAGTCVGALLWYLDDRLGYCHLAAFSDTGYALSASFALFWVALEYLTEKKLERVSIGSGPGLRCDGTDGLSRFKRGWATGSRTTYFCGRIFNLEKYAEIAKEKGHTGSDYFPAYRTGEFT